VIGHAALSSVSRTKITLSHKPITLWMFSTVTSPPVLSCHCVLHYFLTMSVGFHFNLTFRLKPWSRWHQNCKSLFTNDPFSNWVKWLIATLIFFSDAHLWCQGSRTRLQYFQRYRLFSISTFKLQAIWRYHWSNLHNRKISISLKRKNIFRKEKHHSSASRKAFHISTKYFSLHRHFKQTRVFYWKTHHS